MSFTYEEVTKQPLSWELTIQETLIFWNTFKESINLTEHTQFIFIGSGSSFYLSQTAAALFQEITGLTSRAVPASEIFLASSSVLNTHVPTIAFVISRSGKTSEILSAAQYLQKNYRNVQVVGLTCRSSERLTKIVTNAIALDHADEQSVVMTQSFTNMLLALQVVATQIEQREDKLRELKQLPEILSTKLKDFEEFGRVLATKPERDYFVFLGLGKYYGLANEANLKLKEMTQVASDAYNPLEFRHGPISTLTPRSCVVMLNGNEGYSYLSEVAVDVATFGALVVDLSPTEGQRICTATHSLVVDDRLSDWSRTILYMPALQLFAYHKAIALGLDPDKPRNLTQVVVISGT